MKPENTHHRPQDDLPYERRMYYIIRDYRRMLESKDKLKEYTRKLETKIEHLKEEVARKGLKNKLAGERYVFLNRQNKRLKIHIQSLEDQIEALTGVRPLPIDTSNVFIPTQEEE